MGTEGKLQDEIEKLHLRYQAKLDYMIVAKNDVEDTLVDLRGKLKLSRQEHRQQIQESRFGLKDKTNINQNLQEEIDFLSSEVEHQQSKIKELNAELVYERNERDADIDDLKKNYEDEIDRLCAEIREYETIVLQLKDEVERG